MILGLSVVVINALLRSILFPGNFARVDPDAKPEIEGRERLWIDTREGRTEAWFLRGAGVSAEKPGPLVVFAHGNAEAIDEWGDALAPYRRLGLSVLLPEYRGYGRSTGSPTQSALTEDFVRFYDVATSRPDVDRARVVFHGRSLGGAVLASLARERKPAAFVLQSTFTSVTWFAKQWMVPAALIADPFDTLGVVRELDVPLVVIHGTRDSIVPYEHGVELSKASRRGRLVSYDCDHNDMPVHDARFWREIENSLREAGIIGAK